MKKYKNPSLGYPGGKSKVAKKIIEKMPPHNTYVEPFAGASHVFFKKPKAEKNVLNDVNKSLMNFFKDIKGKKICCRVKDSRKEFEHIKHKSSKSPCDVIYLNRTSYGSRNVFGNPGYANRKKKIDREICINGSKLDGVNLETRDFREVMKKHDSKDTFFYIDPPYVKANEKSCLYGKGKCDVTPSEVAKSVRGLKGKAMVSYDDQPSVRKAFKGFKIDKITLPYTFARSGKDKRIKGKKQELLISNFKCKASKQGKICEKELN